MDSLTCLLVHVHSGYASACAPSGNFGNLVHKALQLCTALFVFIHPQNNAQNFWNFAKSFHIPLYHCRVAVVVKEDGVCAVADGMVGLAGVDVYREYCVNDCEGQDVKLGLEEVPGPKRDSPALSSFLALLVLLRRREVWLCAC
jgi:hypothetical protein